MSSQVFLGPFEVFEPIGKGGMGKVFRAVHAMTGVPVAVKVLSGVKSELSRQFFQREIQAHARLFHPGVAYVFDYGMVHPLTARASQGQLIAKSPYIVMELAEGGTLHEKLPLGDWKSVKNVLLQVLDALAFAHARGVIHRDLKPENLLLFPGKEQPWKIKITDFGVAHAMIENEESQDDTLSTFSGTCLYMPPEQINTEWRKYGPWTDLYALGCITWQLVCGRPPFEGDNWIQIAMKHGSDDRPPVTPRFEIPAGLESWIHKAMAIRPRDRFQYAADAARELASLVEPEGGDGKSFSRTEPEVATKEWYTGPTLLLNESPTPTLQMAPVVKASDPQWLATVAHPETWRSRQESPLPNHLVGAGLSLFGLREIPFVDRDQERDRIWAGLKSVSEKQDVEVLFVVGESGAGKSSLVEWMATRAHELGAARVVKALHTSGGQGVAEGISGLVQRAVQGWQLSREEFYEYLALEFPEMGEHCDGDARALTEIVHPTGDEEPVDGPRYQFTSPGQKLAVLGRLLSRLAQDRPAIVWLDDLQWGSQTLAMVEYFCGSAVARPPALIVATLRADALAENESLARRIDTLVEGDKCQRIDLDVLPPADHRQFISGMLQLEPGLAEKLALRTEGNPLFAHQLLSDWIASGILSVGDEGFQLAGGQELSLPDELHELWLTRMQRVFDSIEDSDTAHFLEAIELAAALGREVNHDEWRQLIELAHRPVPPLLLERLTDRGLARRTTEGWSFAHGLLVDSLERSAREAGRWRNHHLRCVEMLTRRYPDKLSQTAMRRAEHLILAGELEEALDPLLEEIKRLESLGDIRQLQEVVHRRGVVLKELALSLDDVRCIDNQLHQGHVSMKSGDTQRAVEILRDALEHSERIGDARRSSRAYQELGSCMQRQDNLEAAQRYLAAALELASSLDDIAWQGKVSLTLGWILLAFNQFEDAGESLLRAQKLLHKEGPAQDRLRADAALGWLSLLQGDLEAALDIFEPLLDETRKSELRAREAECLNALGEIARFSRLHDDAVSFYKENSRIEEEMGNFSGQICASLNISQVLVDAARFDEAKDALEKTESLLERHPVPMYLETIHCCHLALAAGRQQWARFDEFMLYYSQGKRTDTLFGSDYPWLLEIAGRYAAKASKNRRATAVYQLAAELWEQAGNEEAADRVQDKISELI